MSHAQVRFTLFSGRGEQTIDSVRVGRGPEDCPIAIDTLPEKDVFYRYDLAGKATDMVYPDDSH